MGFNETKTFHGARNLFSSFNTLIMSCSGYNKFYAIEEGTNALGPYCRI